MLRIEIGRVGGRGAFARLHGLSQQYLCDVLRGRREPGPKILDALFLFQEIVYRRKIDKRGHASR